VEKPKRVSEISNEENSGEAPTYLWEKKLKVGWGFYT
jgi:hypothetical protein